MCKEDEYREQVVTRWCWLRAIEWTSLPGFWSQVYFPVLLLLVPWWMAAAFVASANVLWSVVRYRFVSIGVAEFSATFVKVAKWPFSISTAIYFGFQHQYLCAVLCIVWAIIPITGIFPGRVGEIEEKFMRKLLRDVAAV
jgi:hypothetical protein